ncbi:sigma-70 family RNA polymerase sigma factor [Bordetella sputigena]|uniref:sigma-70 family RNA polymerase sigma factor n=1 Tax=Bordetella sputigena TaxID=1416810 RepID=UPI0039EF1F61
MSGDELSVHQTTEALYSQHQPWLAGWLRHRMGGEDAAIDLAQDTFVRILATRELPALNEPRAFLATIARRLLANHYRRNAIERAYLDALALVPEEYAPDPEQRKLLLEQLYAIDAALDALPGKVREAFLLAQLEGLKHEEIARRLGVTTRTVGNYMVRAVQACFFLQETAQ